MVYKALILQYIVGHGITFWGKSYELHTTELNSLIKYLFNKPIIHSLILLFKEIKNIVRSFP